MKNIQKIINENGIVSSLIASIIFAILVYIFSKENSILTYKVVTHERLFEESNSEALIILNKDSERISKDIYFLEIDVWNQGDKAITKAELKDDITLAINQNSEFLKEIKVEETHSRVTRAHVCLDSLRRKLVFAFDYLEKNNGVKIKCYYTTKDSIKSLIQVTGYISGGGKIKYFNEAFLEKYNIGLVLTALILGITIIWFAQKYLGDFIDLLIDKYCNNIKFKYFRLLVWLFIYIPIAYFLVIKVLSFAPMWLYDLTKQYFNHDSPFVNL